MIQERIEVGDYIFVQAVKAHRLDNCLTFTPIPDTFAVPGGTFATRQQIKAFAETEHCKIIKEK